MNFQKMVKTTMEGKRLREWLFWMEKCRGFQGIAPDKSTTLYLDEDIEVAGVHITYRIGADVFNHVFMHHSLKDEYKKYRRLQNYEMATAVLHANLPAEEFEEFLHNLSGDATFEDTMLEIAQRYDNGEVVDQNAK